MKMLLCTDGSPYASLALRLGTGIAKKVAAAVDVLAVFSNGEGEAKAARMAKEAIAELKEAGVPAACCKRAGRLAAQVVEQARSTPYDLVVIGSRGRRGLVRLLLGSVALHVAEHVPASVLVVKGQIREPRKFLVCSSAGPASEHTVRFAGRLARALNAAVTLLHVMSQLPLVRDAPPDALEASAEELIQRRTREGIHLHRMLDLLAAEGVAARAVVRHGLVLDEIVAEFYAGQYDLLVIGAHVTPGLSQHLLEDLSAEILLAINRPVLIVR